MSVIKITKDNFQSEVLDSEKTVLLDFYADWCGPCKMVSPIVDAISEEYPEYKIGKVNVDQEAELATTFGVMSIPSIFVIKGGEVANQAVGVRTKAQILDMLK